VEQIVERALDLMSRADRGQPQAWRTALFASQHELITYREQAARSDSLTSDRTALHRGIAPWILPYGVQLQLRQARARRKAVREQGAVRAQRAGSELDPARRA
jgi:hypothetical protein